MQDRWQRLFYFVLTLIGICASAQAQLVVANDDTILTANVDRSELTQIGTGLRPAVSYDGRIAYDDGTYVWVMDGVSTRPLFQGQPAIMPSWSLSGQLAFVSFSVGFPSNAAIWVAASPDSTPRQITSSAAFSYEGSISPDGTRLAFTRQANGHREIYVINIDGTGEYALTNSDDPSAPDANAPAWSPDGTRIAFYCGFAANSTSTSLNQQVCVINVNGTNRMTLTRCYYPCLASDNPAWSPDGSAILYERGAVDYPQGEGLHTWVMGADGTNQHEILPFSYGAGRQPWRLAH